MEVAIERVIRMRTGVVIYAIDRQDHNGVFYLHFGGQSVTKIICGVCLKPLDVAGETVHEVAMGMHGHWNNNATGNDCNPPHPISGRLTVDQICKVLAPHFLQFPQNKLPQKPRNAFVAVDEVVAQFDGADHALQLRFSETRQEMVKVCDTCLMPVKGRKIICCANATIVSVMGLKKLQGKMQPLVIYTPDISAEVLASSYPPQVSAPVSVAPAAQLRPWEGMYIPPPPPTSSSASLLGFGRSAERDRRREIFLNSQNVPPPPPPPPPSSSSASLHAVAPVNLSQEPSRYLVSQSSSHAASLIPWGQQSTPVGSLGIDQ